MFSHHSVSVVTFVLKEVFIKNKHEKTVNSKMIHKIYVTEKI